MGGGLVAACHPLPSAAVTTVAGAFALAAGRGTAGTTAVSLTVLASQLSVGWHNDAVDAERDRIAGRRDKPIVAGLVSASAVRVAFGVATACFLGLAALSGLAGALIAVVAWGSAIAYNAWAKRTIISPAPYAVSFSLLPAFVTVGGSGGEWPPLWIPVAAGLLGVAAHFANVLPDLEADRRTGVWGLPQRLGRGPSTLIAALTLATASVVLVAGRDGGSSPVAVATLGAALGGAATILALGRSADRARARLALLAVIAVAAIDAALLVAAGGAA